MYSTSDAEKEPKDVDLQKQASINSFGGQRAVAAG